MRLVYLLLMVFLAACNAPQTPPATTELIVVTRTGALTYQTKGNHVPNGFEHDLVLQFADSLGVPVRFVVAKNNAQIARMLANGEAHLAAAGLTSDSIRRIPFTHAIRSRHLVLVGHEANSRDISKYPVVETVAGSPEAKLLRSSHPELKVLERIGISKQILLERVATKKTDLIAVDSDNYKLFANFYPVLEILETLPQESNLAWAISPKDPSHLLDKANAFIDEIRENGRLARISDRYFGHVERLTNLDVVSFLQRIQTTLPRYRQHFQTAQEISGIDWRLLAALSYQESHWDPLNTSPTNVRGIMMLTEETADQLGVKDRLDPEESILAGARYLSTLRERLPPNIKEPDRTWMAIAAYNLGFGHLNGGLMFAKGLKRDPRSWYDLKQVLPLLSRPEYYRRLKSGRARGGEAVIMVENIRQYYDILRRFKPPYQSPLSAKKHLRIPQQPPTPIMMSSSWLNKLQPPQVGP